MNYESRGSCPVGTRVLLVLLVLLLFLMPAAAIGIVVGLRCRKGRCRRCIIAFLLTTHSSDSVCRVGRNAVCAVRRNRALV